MNGEKERLIGEVDPPAFRPPKPGSDGPDVSAPARPTQWQQTLRETQRQLLGESSASGRFRGELWLIVNFALRRFLHQHVQRLGALAAADIEDIASEKSLDLLGKIESVTWDISERTDEEIAGFLSRVARNGAVDFLRRQQRHREIEVDLERGRDATESSSSSSLERPDAGLERQRFVEALKACAGQLKPRTRRIWFFRVFYGLSASEISLHPDVALQPKGVDMLLYRTRQKIGDCMERKGYQVTELPAGTFAEIWNMLQSEQQE